MGKQKIILLYDKQPLVVSILSSMMLIFFDSEKIVGEFAMVECANPVMLKQELSRDPMLVIQGLSSTEKTGIELYRELRGIKHDLNIALMSGHPDAGAILSENRIHDCYSLLRKPFIFDEVMAMLHKLRTKNPLLN